MTTLTTGSCHALFAVVCSIAASGCGPIFVAEELPGASGSSGAAGRGAGAGVGAASGAGPAGGSGMSGSGGSAGSVGVGGSAGTGGTTGGTGGTGGVSGAGGTGGNGGLSGASGSGNSGGTGGAPRESIERVSVDKVGVQADGPSDAVDISEDGRFIAFVSAATNLTYHTPTGFEQVYVRDMLTGTVVALSVNADDELANAHCNEPALSADGNVVAFTTRATNLDPNDENSKLDVYIHDRTSNTTERVSVGHAGELSDADAWEPSISGDGRVVAWVSGATNLTSRDTDTLYDVFVRDRDAASTVVASVDSAGKKQAAASYGTSLSADGSLVVFDSRAALASEDQNGENDIFLHNLRTGNTSLISVSSAEVQGSGYSSGARISADGNTVVFASRSTNLVANDTNDTEDLFVRDIVAGTTERVSVSSDDGESDRFSSITDSSISANGRFVAFTSSAETLVSGDTNGETDVYVRDREAGETFRVNLTRTGGQANSFTEDAQISGDGRWVAFVSFATNLVPGDDNSMLDVFVAAVP